MVKGLFDACKKTDPGTINNDGLSIEEIMQKPCVEFLTTVLGLDEDQIENDFKKVDTDGNGRVTLREGRNAFNQLRSKVSWVKETFDCCDKTGKCIKEIVHLDTTQPHLKSCPQTFFSKKVFGTYVKEDKNPYKLTMMKLNDVFCKSENFYGSRSEKEMLVDGLFDACKKIDPGTIDNDGLSIEEVMEKPCVEFLTTVLGLDEDQIENDFKKVDTNGNGRVTLKEGHDAFNQLRSNASPWLQLAPAVEKTFCCTIPYPYNMDWGRTSEAVTVAMDPLNQGSCAQNFFTQSYIDETEPFCGLAKDHCSR